MISSRSIASVAAGLLASVCACAQPVRIELRALAQVPPGPVLLGDVAGIRATDLAQIRSLVNLPLGHAPASGAEVEVTREQVARWIVSRLGERSANLRWEGATAVTVRTTAMQVAGTAIEQTARSMLSRWLTPRSSRHELDVTVAPRDLSVRAGQVALQARPLPAEATVQARQRVWVDVLVDGVVARSVPVDFHVAAYQAIAEPMADTAIAADRTPTREADLTRAAVRRGQPVTLAARAGAIELKASAQALEDGRIGETVRVKAAHAEGPVVAFVVAPGQVEVRP